MKSSGSEAAVSYQLSAAAVYLGLVAGGALVSAGVGSFLVRDGKKNFV